MRNKFALISSLMLIASLLLTACGTTALAQGEDTKIRTLTVNGTGKTYLSPDIAYVSIGVHTENANASEAVASNNTQSQEVAEALIGFKIDKKDIQTTNFSIYPQQQYDQEGKVTGTRYIVDNTVFVTLRDLEKIGEVLNAAVSAGANSINSIQFDVEDKTEALSGARKAAVANARIQAEELATAAGVKLGEVQTIQTYGVGTPVPMYEGKGGGALVAEASVPVSPGQMILTVEVNIVYQIN